MKAKNVHRHEQIIGVGRFRILGGGSKVYNIGWAKGDQIVQQAHDVITTSMRRNDVVTTSMRRNDVASTSFRRHVPTRFLINPWQIITFLILKSDVENSRTSYCSYARPAQCFRYWSLYDYTL